ncbi:MAG TPA: hypothetical protein VK673_22010 [Chthoniobacterales bacterium]|nr:hypothetical protein [Chthoniobacterales bacterium]
MGLIQEIEGIFGFGKKANQQPQDVAAAKAAAAKLDSWLQEGEGIVSMLAPFAATNPVVAAFVGIVQAGLTDGDAAVKLLESWIPAPTAPATPAPAPPASPPKTS